MELNTLKKLFTELRDNLESQHWNLMSLMILKESMLLMHINRYTLAELD